MALVYSGVKFLLVGGISKFLACVWGGGSSHPPSMENLALLVVVVNIKIKQKIKILGFYTSVSKIMII